MKIHIRDLIIGAICGVLIIQYINLYSIGVQLDMIRETLEIQEGFMINHRHTPVAIPQGG